MSTRANILITAKGEKPLWFYRHSDGYPEGVIPTLSKFMEWLKEGRIRDNIGQAAGWLIVLGHLEYRDNSENALKYNGPQFEPGARDSISGWKVGAYEPTSWEEHGDIDYRYTIDLTAKTLICEEVGGGYDDKPKTYKRVSLAKYLKAAAVAS